MKLRIEGNRFRTSGSAAPIESFAKTYEVGDLLDKEEGLPWPGLSISLTQANDDFVKGCLQVGYKKIDFCVNEDQPTSIRHEENILGMEFTFVLTK